MNLNLLSLFSRFLELSGFNCKYFTDPRLALDNYSKNSDSYCLVIADLKMPKLDGLELTRRLRKYNKTVKILLVTGYLVEENIDYDQAKEAGIDVILEKPFHFKELVPAIKELLAEKNIFKIGMDGVPINYHLPQSNIDKELRI